MPTTNATPDDLERPSAPATEPEAGVLERDRLGRFFPALLALTTVAAAIEAIAAVALNEPAFATAAASTGLFAIAVVIAGHQVRQGHPVRARAALAIGLTFFGAIGAILVPGVGASTALLPLVSVILILPHVPRHRLVLVLGAALVSAFIILVLDELPQAVPAIAGPAGIALQDAILLGIVILILVGLVDFAMDARDALSDLREASRRQLEAIAERLAIVGSLRHLREQSTTEATAGRIVTALAELPHVDVAVILEATENGLVVLATAGDPAFPFRTGHLISQDRSAYMLARCREGAWSERWSARISGSPDDSRLAEFGVKGQAFAPIVVGDETVGLVGIVTTSDHQANRFVGDLPAVREFASVADAILGPGLVAGRQLRIARVKIADIIAARAYHPAFQPIVDLATGQTVGFEALTRFAGGSRPDHVFADAARVGLGQALEAATLAAAIRDAADLPPGTWLSLNVSPALLADCDVLVGLLADRTRPIMLEVTEHDRIDDYAPLHAAMRRLGPDVRLAVDDAGAGVANFGHLVDLRPDLVKIDASLIRGANADVSRQALIVGLVHFAAASGALVLAEGIETAAEQETVHRLGVTLGQGFHLARPGPVGEWLNASPAAGPATPGAKVIPIRRHAKVG